MKKHLLAAAAAALLATVASAADKSGIELQYVDPAVRAQDDFFKHLNGKWLATTEIPAEMSSWGAFEKLFEDIQPQLRTIIEDSAQSADTADKKRIGDFYAAFMDEARLEQLGVAPIQAELARIAALSDKKQLPALFAYHNRHNFAAPMDMGIHQDNKDSTKYVVDFVQSGLGMPDRDYYLKKDDAKMAETLAKYQTTVEKMLALAGDTNAASNAKSIVAFETRIAQLHWTKVELRDPVKAYNKVPVAKLGELMPGYDWNAYLNGLGIAGKVDYVIVSQPSYLKALDKLLAETPLETLKPYFAWNVIRHNAPFLSKAFVETNFEFYGKQLGGATEMRPRWKRGVSATEDALGESIGKVYVEQHFPAANKARMEELVKNLLVAYKDSIDKLPWMSAKTKQEAQTKLAKFTPKIGYPNKWRDYSALTIDRNDLVGNVTRATEFAVQKELDKLGKPIDRDEWGMTPQTVNAYYNPELNEIVFPAAILQPPFFDANADDAVNYGAIGAVIGHEISHGFDDQGAQYDGDGNLRDWWTKRDHANFKTKTQMLVKQYGAFSPVKGYKVNGELTLGENIADNSGLAIAYKAYKLSLGGKPAPVIEGFSGEQRFYQGWAQAWRAKSREAALIRQVTTDPHSPEEFRANGTLRNQPGFYDAFGVKKGDKMYLTPKERVIIW
ncbi:M13 family metallopeptidase [Duganella sp. Root198D2]|uniref:M13 family metallopeptidase n=1 Tax=Duganella sp. Root198D2 TaxID=1736489 RepID=UPI00070B69E4|nr:M13-type metalloendopeptidase [Duganella sp. Root198D2]KRB93421.1 peptidase M13 [Duganella sp. Root198D2]